MQRNKSLDKRLDSAHRRTPVYTLSKSQFVDPNTATDGLLSVAESIATLVGEITYRMAARVPFSISVILPVESTE